MSPQSPAAPALEAPQGVRALVRLSVVAAVKALGLVFIAEAVARGVTALIAGGDITLALSLGLAGALLRGLAAWAVRALGASAAVGVKTSLRARALARITGGSGRDLALGDGALTLGLTRSLDDLDDYFTSVLPALTSAMVVPLALLVRIVFADWVSALILALTLPLVPVFMVLIGRYTQERVADAVHALDQLSTNLVELTRGLPVLVGLGRVHAQTATLRAMAKTYRDTTMQTLRVAFLSALALELISTISVALVAVFIGVRLVNGQLSLETGLLALVLAPELFLPLRQLGAAFHSSENGMAAYQRARRLAAGNPHPPFGTRTQPGPIRAAEVSVSYAGRSQPALAELSAEFPVGLSVLTGASGSGKSTFLGVLAGLVRPGETTLISGQLSGPLQHLAYAGQNPHTYARTVAQELDLYAGTALGTRAQEYLRRACLPVSPDTPCAALSPGEARRLALARAFARVDAGAQVLLVDEPTAHLDAGSAAAVRAELAQLAARIPVIAASHDPVLMSMGDVVSVDGAATAAAPVEPTEAGIQEAADSQAAAAEMRKLTAPGSHDAPAVPLRTALRRLGRTVDFRSWNFCAAVVCGVLAVAAGSALTGVSAWLIVHASFQPPMMYLLVAIVGVRFFGLSRSVFAYVKQLRLHDAVLSTLADLRTRVWTAFARSGTANRTLARGDVALRRLIGDIDDIRDAAPRVVLPPIVALIVGIAAAAVLAWVAPAAGVLTVIGMLIALLAAPAITLAADRQATAVAAKVRSTVLGRIVNLLGAREDLIVNGRAQAVVATVIQADEQAARLEKTAVRAHGLGEGLITITWAAVSVLMLPLLAPQVAAGAVSPELLAVAVLLPLSLTESFIDALSSVQQWPALRKMLARVSELDAADTPEEQPAAAHARVLTTADQAVLKDISARWEGLREPVFAGVCADIRRGEWTAVTGPSGSGKTTLVSVLLRFLDPNTGTYLLDEHNALALTSQDVSHVIAWCPQESHVFDSSLRNNLRIARDAGSPPEDAEMTAVLERVGLGGLLADIGLDEPIGASGSYLSGGQRQRLAVARTLLAGSSIVILDEPTAHLDEALAHALLADMRGSLADRAVVLVTHDPSLLNPGDRHVRL